MEWLIWVLVAFALFRLIGFSCPTGRLRPRGQASHHLRSGGELLGPPGVGLVRTRPRRRPEAMSTAETPMQSLQRRFVDGRITVEQYEAELDRLFAHSRRAGDAQPG